MNSRLLTGAFTATLLMIGCVRQRDRGWQDSHPAD